MACIIDGKYINSRSAIQYMQSCLQLYVATNVVNDSPEFGISFSFLWAGPSSDEPIDWIAAANDVYIYAMSSRRSHNCWFSSLCVVLMTLIKSLRVSLIKDNSYQCYFWDEEGWLDEVGGFSCSSNEIGPRESGRSAENERSWLFGTGDDGAWDEGVVFKRTELFLKRSWPDVLDPEEGP